MILPSWFLQLLACRLSTVAFRQCLPELCNLRSSHCKAMWQSLCRSLTLLHVLHMLCLPPRYCVILIITSVSSGLQSMVPTLGLAEQQAPHISSADDSLQCNAECDDMHASSLDHEEGASGCSTGVSEMASRPPTQQEIQHMDELDLSINLGSLLGPGDNWMVEEEDQLRLSHLEPRHATAANGGSLDNCKPFQELFP